MLYFREVLTIVVATNTPRSVGDLLLVLGTSLVTSKGAHGGPGAAIVILAATPNAAPAIGLVLVLSIDWFIAMARALGDLIGNCVATVATGPWEHDRDVTLASRVHHVGIQADLTADGMAGAQAAE